VKLTLQRIAACGVPNLDFDWLLALRMSIGFAYKPGAVTLFIM